MIFGAVDRLQVSSEIQAKSAIAMDEVMKAPWYSSYLIACWATPSTAVLKPSAESGEALE